MQHDEDVEHQYSKMSCTTNQFPELIFLIPHNKPYGVIGLIKHYHMHFYPQLGHGTCEIRQIPCACNNHTSTLDKLWNPGVEPHQQPRYQPVKYFTYWPVLHSFNNWKIIHFSHKETSSEDLEKPIR